MFKKIRLVVTIGAVGIAFTGLQYGEVLGIFQAVRAETGDAIRDAVPLSIEARRMEQLLEKLDGQIAKQKRALAERGVALEDAQRQLAAREERADSQMASMKVLRKMLDQPCQTVTVGCHKYSMTELESTLARSLANYKAACKVVESEREAVRVQQEAVKKLGAQASQWRHERDLLAHRIEALKSRIASQKAKPHDPSVFATDALKRANEVADRVEGRLRVAEKQEALGADPLESLGEGNPSVVDPRAAFDALLDEHDAGAAGRRSRLEIATETNPQT